jgi:hypothetical protein
VRDVVGRLATEMGKLAADGGAALAHDADWQAFFDFIRTDAAPTLDAFARATGNVVAGLGSILVAFRPLSDDFTSGMLDMSRSFREWAANLGDSDGFREFVGLHPRERPGGPRLPRRCRQAMVGSRRRRLRGARCAADPDRRREGLRV